MPSSTAISCRLCLLSIFFLSLALPLRRSRRIRSSHRSPSFPLPSLPQPPHRSLCFPSLALLPVSPEPPPIAAHPIAAASCPLALTPARPCRCSPLAPRTPSHPLAAAPSTPRLPSPPRAKARSSSSTAAPPSSRRCPPPSRHFPSPLPAAPCPSSLLHSPSPRSSRSAGPAALLKRPGPRLRPRSSTSQNSGKHQDHWMRTQAGATTGICAMNLRLFAGKSGSKLEKIVAPKLRKRLSGPVAGTNLGSSKQCAVQKFFLLFQSCADVRSLKKLHARVLTHGLAWNVILNSKILGRYANLVDLPESRLVFQKIVGDDLAIWSSAMVDYFRAGYIEEVIVLYRRLKFHQIGLDGRSITFGLKSCTETMNLLLGKGMHVDSLKLGLSGDKFVGSSLVGLYSKLGKMDDSRKVFQEVISKDIVAYTSMISGYSDVVDSTAWNAFELASDMIRNNLEVNRVTLVSLLQVAGNLGVIRVGKSLHCYSIRNGIGLSDEVLETSLVDMYARCGSYQLASALLKNSKGTVASWNALLSGLTRIRESWDAIQYFSMMLHQHKVTPDSVTFANILSACADLCYSGYAASVHAYLMRRTIPLDVVLATALIEVYSKCKRFVRSRHLFDHLTAKDAVSYNAMIYGYLQNGMADEGTALLNRMMEEYIAPNSVTVLCLLAAFADERDLVRGRWIHGFAIRHGFSLDMDIANQILHMYSVCRELVAARIVFDSLEKKNLISWTAMMKGYLFFGHGDEVVRLYQLMQQHGDKSDSITLVYTVQAVSELGHLKGVKQIHCFVYHASLEKDAITTNSLITAYAKCGRLDLSVSLFHSLEHKDLDSWNAMMSAYGMHGFYVKVLEMFNQMDKENITPDDLTFSSVLSACSHGGLVKEGWCIFQLMTSVYSVHPQEEHYGCIVDLLGRAGHLEEGYQFIKLSRVTDKSSIFRSLLSACRTYGNTQLAHIISKDLLQHGPQNLGTYALISEVYAQKGQWNESANLRAIATERKLKKLPGSSLIESVEQAIYLG